MSDCCLKGFQWKAEPQGRSDTIAGLDCYISGSNEDVAVMIIHGLFGWTFNNIRILADHLAQDIDANVYVPDCFGVEVVPTEILSDKSRAGEFDLGAFLKRNSKAVRKPEIIKFTESLRSSFTRIGAVGYCYGGWAVFNLGTKGNNLVECISTAHPSLLEKEEIANIGVLTQILALEVDHMFTPELKAYTNEILPKAGVAYDYQYFPGLEHGFAIRGDETKPGERDDMERAKNAVSL
ncbi:putative endo-1,3-1,4-beta-D-glucanase [Fusarium oxysporum]|nr:putative endo-1,3-1,4-beta-D-glucanase [Fusarium oxysporum]